jgi:hypothetical protein
MMRMRAVPSLERSEEMFSAQSAQFLIMTCGSGGCGAAAGTGSQHAGRDWFEGSLPQRGAAGQTLVLGGKRLIHLPGQRWGASGGGQETQFCHPRPMKGGKKIPFCPPSLDLGGFLIVGSHLGSSVACREAHTPSGEATF